MQKRLQEKGIGLDAELEVALASGEIELALPDIETITWVQPRKRLTSTMSENTAFTACLEELTELSTVDLRETDINDAGLVHLQGTGQTRHLFLNDTQVSGGLAHIWIRLTNLSVLTLYRSQVTDAELVHLKGLTKLSRVNLIETRVTDAGVKELEQALPSVKIEH